ncbi:MAG: hypothetical protein FJY11_03830 [Bacteroidetes bacterium]|nr:hypothetical protein [Bacteroidota bacterium]
MGAPAYYIIYTFIRIVTLLPLPVLYGLSYPIWFIICCFPGYRRKVTRNNLRNAFPDKSPGEIRRIERRFYMHLADMFIETLKAGHMPEKEIKRRFRVTNPELPMEIMRSGRDVLAVGGHYNNWEWLIATPLYMDGRIVIIYKPLKDKRFNELIFKLRSRFGIVLTPMSGIVRELISFRNQGIRTMSVFIADQAPPRTEVRYWTRFLNQDTAVYLGAEKISTRFNMAVLFLNYRKVRRGHYELTFEELFSETGNLPEYTVTEAHVKRLEELIKEKPEHWIWSHRRWKHRKEVAVG